MNKLERLVHMPQTVVSDERPYMRQFGLIGPQKFLARGNVEEEVADFDGGSGVSGTRLGLGEFTAAVLDFVGTVGARTAGFRRAANKTRV